MRRLRSAPLSNPDTCPKRQAKTNHPPCLFFRGRTYMAIRFLSSDRTGLSLDAFFFATAGTKKKALQKRNAGTRGALPRTPGSFLKKAPPKTKREGLSFCKERALKASFILVYAQRMPQGFSSLIMTRFRTSTALLRPSSMVIRLSSCSMLSTRS